MNRADVRRVSPTEARHRTDQDKALLVCGYESDEQFTTYRLANAESLHQFRTRLPLPFFFDDTPVYSCIKFHTDGRKEVLR